MDRRSFTPIARLCVLAIVSHAGTAETRSPSQCEEQLASTLSELCPQGSFDLGNLHSGLRRSRQVRVAQTLAVTKCCFVSPPCSEEDLRQYCTTPPATKRSLNPSPLDTAVSPPPPSGQEELLLTTLPPSAPLKPTAKMTSRRVCGGSGLTKTMIMVCGHGNFNGRTGNSGHRKTRQVKAGEKTLTDRCCNDPGCTDADLREYCERPPPSEERDLQHGLGFSSTEKETSPILKTEPEVSTLRTEYPSHYFIEVSYETYSGDIFAVN